MKFAFLKYSNYRLGKCHVLHFNTLHYNCNTSLLHKRTKINKNNILDRNFVNLNYRQKYILYSATIQQGKLLTRARKRAFGP